MALKQERCIKDMKIGESGFTCPWAVDCESLNNDGSYVPEALVIRGDYSVHSAPWRGATMKVKRVSVSEIEIDDTDLDYSFSFSGHRMMTAWHPMRVLLRSDVWSSALD